MIDLSNVTLFIADCVDVNRAVVAIERCKAAAQFGAVKFLTSLPTTYPHIQIDPITSLVHYSVFMLKKCVDFVDTEKMLVIQHDGYIINKEAWNPEWADLDYIGPLFLQDGFMGSVMVGSGGFSLRSRKLMQYVKNHTPAWDGTYEHAGSVQNDVGSYEDGVISYKLRRPLEDIGCKYGTPEQATVFAQGGYPQWVSSNPRDRRYYVARPWGHHGCWGNINKQTGYVSPPPFGMPGQFEYLQEHLEGDEK